jgi:hypothetical protein
MSKMIIVKKAGRTAPSRVCPFVVEYAAETK